MRKSRFSLTAKRLRELLDYNPATGAFTWRTRAGTGGQNRRQSRQAGSVWTDGYRHISVDYASFFAARLAVLWMTGRWPRAQIDHINRNRSDDRWRNLREATPHQNRGNSFNKNNALGLKGVCWEAQRRKFKAYIEIDGKAVNLGRFDTAEEAQAAYRAAAARVFGNFARISA